jgi:hypothetical protein
LGVGCGVTRRLGHQVMALTLEAEQRLETVSLVGLYGQHAGVWLKAAKETKAFIAGNFPEGSIIRRDLLPDLPSFIRRVCSSFAPGWGVLRTQLV